MANHASAKKRIRQITKRTARNKHIKSTLRTYVKRVRAAVEAGDKATASELLATAVSKIDSAVHKGIFHRKTGSRYIGRLTRQVNAL